MSIIFLWLLIGTSEAAYCSMHPDGNGSYCWLNVRYVCDNGRDVYAIGCDYGCVGGVCLRKGESVPESPLPPVIISIIVIALVLAVFIIVLFAYRMYKQRIVYA